MCFHFPSLQYNPKVALLHGRAYKEEACKEYQIPIGFCSCLFVTSKDGAEARNSEGVLV
jgi:hypothetical protein